MTTVDKLLDLAKSASGATNDKELAERLGVKPSAVSNYRHGRAMPDAVVCATIAGLTGEPLARVLGVVGEVRAISRAEKAVWRRLAATAAMVLCAIGLAAPGLSNAGETGFSAMKAGTECILCSVRYWWGTLLLVLGQNRPPRGYYIEARL